MRGPVVRAEVRRTTWMWGKWLAVGLAAASAGVWLVERLDLVITVAGSLTLTVLAYNLLYLLLRVAVPAAGWLATRWDGRRVSLGLAVIAVWGAAYHLAPELALLVAKALHPLSQLGGVDLNAAPGALTYVPGAAASLAALVALCSHPGSSRPLGTGPRAAAAAGVAVWAVTIVGVPLGQRALSSPRVGGAPWVSASTVAGFLVLLVVAAVVWRGDSVTAVGAAAVVSFGALVSVLTTALAVLTAGPQQSPLPGSDIEGVALLVQAMAAAVLVAATTHLAGAAVVSWRGR